MSPVLYKLASVVQLQLLYSSSTAALPPFCKQCQVIFRWKSSKQSIQSSIFATQFLFINVVPFARDRLNTVFCMLTSDVMIIEIKIEIVIFTKIKLNRNCDFASYSCNFVKAELVSNSKTLQRLALLLNEVETHFASSGLNFDIHNITSPIP